MKLPPCLTPTFGTILSDCAADQLEANGLGQLKTYPTADGSFSLHSDHFGEAFHNSAGALNEARAKFARPSELNRFQQGQTLRVLDVCVGLAYNSAVLFEGLSMPPPHLQWWGLELDSRPLQLAMQRGDFRGIWSNKVLQRLQAIHDQAGWQSPGERGELIWGDARQTLAQIPASEKMQLIFHDAFSPGRCPQLWSDEFLHALANRLAPGGRLLTYSRAASVRASLQRAGLHLFSLLPAPGERAGWSSGTMAVQPGKAIQSCGPGWRSLTTMEIEHLQTRAAVPFRDPTGRDDATTILQNRKEEQQNCGLEATNAWQRRWAQTRAQTRRPTGPLIEEINTKACNESP